MLRARAASKAISARDRAIAALAAAGGASGKERKRSPSNLGQDCVTFRVRDEAANELHFKVSMTIRLQKVHHHACNV